MKEIKRVAIIGLGALGASYARRISKYSPDIELFGVVKDVETVWGSPIIVNRKALKINYRTVETLKQVPLDLIIICVKTYELKDALIDAREIADSDTLLMGFSCGIDTYRQMLETFDQKQIVPCIAVGTDVNRLGRYITVNTHGTLCYSEPRGISKQQGQKFINSIDTFLRNAHLRNEYCTDIRLQVWKQFMFDIAVGQTAAIYQMTYGELLKSEKAFETVSNALEELKKLASCYDVNITDSDISNCLRSIQNYSSNSRSAMLQDYWMDRAIESKALCDKVMRLAKENKLRLNENERLYDEIHKLIQKGSIKPFDDGTKVVLSNRNAIKLSSDNIASQLRMEILKGKYPAGAKLKETELAHQFDASRSTVRTAMQMLSDEGLLKILPNGRREIIHFGEKEIRDLFDYRFLIEKKALEMAFELENPNWRALEEAMESITNKYEDQSTMEWNELDVCYHSALVDAADNIFLSNNYRKHCNLWYSLTGFNHILRLQPGYPSHFYGEHVKLTNLIKNKDKAAFSALKAHIDSGKEEALQIGGFK